MIPSVDVVVSWVLALGGLGAVVLSIFAANYFRNRFGQLNQNWENAVVPAIAFLTLHLLIWWMWPNYWMPFYESNGFALLQIVLVFGIYSMTLRRPAPKWLGRILVTLATIGLLLNAWPILTTQLREWRLAKKTDINLSNSTGTVSSSALALPVNTAKCLEVAEFYRRNLPADEAEIMTQHIRDESGCNQFRPDGSVYRNIPVNGSSSTAMGIAQILEGLHSERARELGYDLGREEDNLRFSLVLIEDRKQKGESFDEDWKETRRENLLLARRSDSLSSIGRPDGAPVFRVETELPCEEYPDAPVGEWSEWIRIGSNTNLSSSGHIWLQDKEERNIPLGKIYQYKIDWTEEIRIRSFERGPSALPVQVIIRRC